MKIPEGFDLETYGSQLAAARVARGLSREELSAQLFLPSGLLRLLEEGDSRNLPEAVYVVSMYRKVAGSLGLDPAPMIDKLKACGEEQDRKQAEEPQTTPSRRGQPAPPIKPGSSRSNTSGRTDDERRTGADQTIMLIGVLIGLVAAGFFFVRWLDGRPTRPPRNADALTPPALVEQPVTPQVAVDEVVIEPPSPAPRSPEALASEVPLPDGKVRFVINGESWFSVRDGEGQLLYEGLPEPLSRLDFDAASGLAVKAGRPDLVFWLTAGEELQILGNINAVDWITVADASPPGAPPVQPEPVEAQPAEPDPVAPPPPAQPLAADGEVTATDPEPAQEQAPAPDGQAAPDS